MKWSTVTVGVMILGIIGVSIILLFQQITTTNENDYYLLKEITEAAMIDSIDISHYRETGELKIVREKFIENFTRRFSESTLIIGTSYTIKFFDVMEVPPKVSVMIDTGIENYKIYNTVNSYKVLNNLSGILEYVGKNGKKGLSTKTNPYEVKTYTKDYYAIIKKNSGGYDKSLSVNVPEELVSGKYKNIELKSVEYQSESYDQGKVNLAILQRDIVYNNADDDYGFFLPLDNIEKNVYNGNSIRGYNCITGGVKNSQKYKNVLNVISAESIACDNDNKYWININSSSGSRDYAIIKYRVTWQYEDYKYKLS